MANHLKGALRVYVPALCCEHTWVDTGFLNDDSQLIEACDYCPATCARDESGRIVDYDLGVEYE
jgi:hypothetical protein